MDSHQGTFCPTRTAVPKHPRHAVIPVSPGNMRRVRLPWRRTARDRNSVPEASATPSSASGTPPNALEKTFSPYEKASSAPREASSTSGDASSTSGKPSNTSPCGIKSLFEPADAVVDIVFVHGLNGHRELTWTARGAAEPWPKLLLPHELPTARILAFGYDASVANWKRTISENRIGDHSQNLLTSLAAYREKDETNGRSIIFVCHSLGGLVCEDALVRSQQRVEPHLVDILESTRSIAFLGTPHHGSGLARWAEKLSRHFQLMKQTNSNIVATLRRESEVLARIQDSFHTMILARNKDPQHNIDITCFFEELPLPVVGQVVPQDSAILPGYISIGIRSNHMDMARFQTIADPGFVSLSGELRRWIKQLRTEASQPKGKGVERESPAPFLVPYTNNPNFIGRSDILEALRTQLNGLYTSAGTTSQPRACLHGLGGIGKTQIALAYIFWLRNAHPEVSVFWIHASNAERFREAYASIAKECRVPGYDDPKSDVLMLVNKWLLQQRDRGGKWLMVIDNADDLQTFFGRQQKTASPDVTDTGSSNRAGQLADYIPDCPDSAILVTTRNLQVGSRLTRGRYVNEVTKMDESETEQLLRSGLDSISFAPDESTALSARLEHLPLALVQAASFIRENSITVSHYLGLLDRGDQHEINLLSEDFETIGRDSETPRTVAETWILSFEQIKGQNALASELLSLMSLLDRQGIPLKFLTVYCKNQDEQLDREPTGDIQLTKALGILKAFSFIIEDNNGQFNMHRLVQLVTRKWLSKRGDMNSFVEQALIAVSECFPFGYRHENQATCNAYLPHVSVVLKHKGRGSRAERLARASLLHNQAGLLKYQGRSKDAEGLLLKAWELRKSELGEEDPETLTSGNNLAAVYCDQGRYQEAEGLWSNVLAKQRKTLGEEHPDTLTSMHNLASAYSNQGRWKEAVVLGLKVLEAERRILGEEHQDTLMSIGNLSRVYRRQGRSKEAEELQVQVLEIRRRVLGMEHPDTLQSMNDLAETYDDQGMWKEAEQLLGQAVETQQRTLGDEHPGPLSSMHRLASSYIAQGRWAEAEELLVQVVEVTRRLLGMEHPGTLASMGALAHTYAGQGRLREAEELQVQVLEMKRRVLGDEHPEVLTSMHNLACTWQDMGKSAEAVALMEDCFRLQKKVLGEEHPDTLGSMYRLAQLCDSQGGPDRAIALMEDCIRLRKKVLGEEHRSTLLSMHGVAVMWRDQGRPDEALSLMEDCFRLRKKVFGEEHRSTLLSMHEVAVMWRDQGRPEEALSLMEGCFQLEKKVLGEEHQDTLVTMHELAVTLRRQDRSAEAMPLMEDCFRLRKKVLGEEHRSTLRSMHEVAVMWKIQGRPDEALSLMEDCVRLKSKVFGVDDDSTLASKSWVKGWREEATSEES
ncbi:hypothetical protein B0T16DRAFT_497593 [Cercophora newfieldiana]|uniref:DUF7779 domain-containing protein n=1 Tax=Cercophora newfieldiana TaxID=92897 RepID=A0AA39XSV9_9PEZI|nr:hypothetical protein B0T16DRAFT_497593 [Cercophora newfieldiana]